jgi:hydrophobic/amphiphilic exporter-1 (mainly G- bacteria), HAE1 family
MNIPELFIRRPVMTTLVTSAITIFGIMAYQKLPVSDLPNIDFPTISVSASLPGASPETMAASVATPLEQQFSTIAGVDSMTSTSSLGSTSISLQFNLDRDIDGAAQDVQSAISAVQRRLPQDMPTPPTFRKSNPTDSPVMLLALTSETIPLSEVNEYAETLLAQRISSVDGVAQVQVMGAQKYAVRVRIDPRALAARNMGIDEVRTALNTNNVNLPAGTIDGPNKAVTLTATGQLGRNAESFRKVIVTYRNGAAVRLGDVADVADSVENEKSASWFLNRSSTRLEYGSGPPIDTETRSIILFVQRQPGTNTIKVVDGIKELLPSFRNQLPASVSLDIYSDRSIAIRESVHDVKFTLVLAICLVVLVIFLFLRTVWATIIPSIAMPIAIVGTFAVMYFFDFSVDNLSLLALTLSVGFVVDDAIVMLENIVRHIEHGETPMVAALKGSREIGFTIISMTISLVAVFIPVLFMKGVLGRLLHEFAVTISAAILVSGFVSLTLTPMLCSRFLKPFKKDAQHGVFYRTMERIFDGGLGFYERTLRISLRFRLVVLLGAIATVGLTIWLLLLVPKGFIPTEDTGRIYINTEAAQDASFDAMVRYQRQLSAIVAANPYVENYSSSIGSYGRSGGGTNTGRIYAGLIDRKLRPPGAEIAQKLRADLAKVPGVRCFPSLPPAISIGGRASSSTYQYTLSGTDLKELYRITPLLLDKVKEIPGLIDVNSDLQIVNPQLIIEIDRDKTSSLGLNAQQVEDTLYSAFGSRQVSTIFTPTNQYFVVLELDKKYQGDARALSFLYLRNRDGKLIPLEAVSKVRSDVGPLTVTHLGQVPSVTITFNLGPGVALSQATTEIERIAREMLPATISGTFQGTAAAFTSSLQGLGWMLLIAVVVIYLVLGVLYEDFVHPITILSGLPAATFGALLTLVVFGQELNIYGYVGLIMLIGIVKKNAIMMIDFALAERRERNKPAEEAIYQACIVRFRPIMMTTLAALAGTLPIALGWGAGAESRRTLGLAVVGGLLVSQLLTLYITPVFYLYMEKFTKYLTPRPADELEREGVTAAGMAK